MEEVRSYLPYWLRPGDDRRREEIDEEIAEELRLHMDLLVQAREQDGMSTEEARRSAEQRFGDAREVRRRCLKIKQGDVAMLGRIQAALTLLLLFAVFIVGWRQWAANGATVQFMNQTTSYLTTIRNDMEGLRNDLLSAGEPGRATEEEPAKLGDVSGSVENAAGEPIKGARVLAVFKSWPGGDYQQVGRTIVTDPQGQFVFRNAVATNRPHGIQIAVFAEGYAFQSRYEMIEHSAPAGESQQHSFRLEASMPVTLQLPLRAPTGPEYDRLTFRPSERQTADGHSHTVYKEGIELVEVVTNEQGRVTLPWFAAGDTARVTVSGQFGPFEQFITIGPDGLASLKGSQQYRFTPVAERP